MHQPLIFVIVRNTYYNVKLTKPSEYSPSSFNARTFDVFSAGAHTQTHMRVIFCFTLNHIIIFLSWITSENSDCLCCRERGTNTAGPVVGSQGVQKVHVPLSGSAPTCLSYLFAS